jgi:anaphase-promoting complex subunit 2
MAVFEQYVMGMLTNFEGGLPLNRIHNMLKMFVVEPPYDKTSEQLEGFLRQLIAEEKIQIEGSLFKKRS